MHQLGTSATIISNANASNVASKPSGHLSIDYGIGVDELLQFKSKQPQVHDDSSMSWDPEEVGAFGMYATVVLIVLGAEYLLWRHIHLSGNWDEDEENSWHVAQFVFLILVGTSIWLATQGIFLSLPLLVTSMWTLGFPETILLFCSASYEKKHGYVERLVDMLDGVGTVVHHSSTALYIAMLLSQILPPTREVLAVIPYGLMQHWFGLLKYDYKWSYAVIETVFFQCLQWACFSTVAKVIQIHWIGGVIWFSMLFAHWCYSVAGIIGLIFLIESKQEDETTLNQSLRSSRRLTL